MTRAYEILLGQDLMQIHFCEGFSYAVLFLIPSKLYSLLQSFNQALDILTFQLDRVILEVRLYLNSAVLAQGNASSILADYICKDN